MPGRPPPVPRAPRGLPSRPAGADRPSRNGLAERRRFGWLETELHLHLPDQKLIVHNSMGRPATLPRGSVRTSAAFPNGPSPEPPSSTRNSIPISAGVLPDSRPVADHPERPDTILAFFGWQILRWTGPGRILRRKWTPLSVTHAVEAYNGVAAKLVLVSPLPSKTSPRRVIFPMVSGKWPGIALTDACAGLPERHGLTFVDLFNATKAGTQKHGLPALTMNGFCPRRRPAMQTRCDAGPTARLDARRAPLEPRQLVNAAVREGLFLEQ